MRIQLLLHGLDSHVSVRIIQRNLEDTQFLQRYSSTEQNEHMEEEMCLKAIYTLISYVSSLHLTIAVNEELQETLLNRDYI